MGVRLKRALALVVMARVVLGLAGWIVVTISPVSYHLESWYDLRVAMSSSWYAVVGPWQQWDGLWFQQIAAYGYSPHGGEASFFPLFPMLERAAGWILGGNYGLAGLLVSTVALTIALTLLDALLTEVGGYTRAWRTNVLLVLCPVGFFLLAPFSESLFLCLSVAAIYGARRRRWWLAGTCGLAAALTRSVGLLLMIPLFIEAVNDAVECRRDGVGWFRARYVAVLAPALGFVAYWVYVAGELAIPGGPLQAASDWGQHFAWPWVVIPRSWNVVWSGNHTEETLNLVAALLLIVCLPFMWKRMPKSLWFYAAAMVPVLCFRTATTTPLMSSARYALVVFPLFYFLGGLLGNRWLRWSTYAGFGAVQLWMFASFARASFIA